MSGGILACGHLSEGMPAWKFLLNPAAKTETLLSNAAPHSNVGLAGEAVGFILHLLVTDLESDIF